MCLITCLLVVFFALGKEKDNLFSDLLRVTFAFCNFYCVRGNKLEVLALNNYCSTLSGSLPPGEE